MHNMKKSIIIITAVSFLSFFSFTALAQNAADKKPKIDNTAKTIEQDKTAATAPQIVPAAQALKVEDQPKPIVPGGEFKPMDTNKPLASNTETGATNKAQPAPMPALKKAGPPPVVTEINPDPSAQERAKPAPVQVIQQKQ